VIWSALAVNATPEKKKKNGTIFFMKGGANVENANPGMSLSQNEVVPYEYTFILLIWLRVAGGKSNLFIPLFTLPHSLENVNAGIRFGNRSPLFLLHVFTPGVRTTETAILDRIWPVYEPCVFR
jgi:hypothetical protein